MTVIERKAVEVLASGEWPDSPKHGTWRAECMVAWLKDAGIELVDASTTQGAVDALALIAGYFNAGWPDDDDVREIGRIARDAHTAARGQ